MSLHPATINLTDAYDLSVQDVPVEPGKPIQVSLPKSGTFLVGPYTAPENGRIQFRFEGATANAALKSRLGFKLRVSAECQAALPDLFTATFLGV